MPVTDLSGTSLGIFQLQERLATDVYGEIYRARQTDSERDVALRVTQVAASASPTNYERFVSEAKILVSLEHERIATVYAYGSEDPLVYIAMRLLTGGTLAAQVEGWSQNDLLTFVSRLIPELQGIADALDSIHRRGIIHRSISPHNLVFDQQRSLYLTNFGLVRARSEKSADEMRVGIKIKPPPFWAPEGWISDKLTDKSDQFSLAATLYFCLTGRAPFMDVKGERLVYEYIAKEIIPTEVLAPLPEALGSVFRQAFARKPENRFRDVSAMVQALQSVIAPAPAPSVSSPPPAGVTHIEASSPERFEEKTLLEVELPPAGEFPDKLNLLEPLEEKTLLEVEPPAAPPSAPPAVITYAEPLEEKTSLVVEPPPAPLSQMPIVEEHHLPTPLKQPTEQVSVQEVQPSGREIFNPAVDQERRGHASDLGDAIRSSITPSKTPAPSIVEPPAFASVREETVLEESGEYPPPPQPSPPNYAEAPASFHASISSKSINSFARITQKISPNLRRWILIAVAMDIALALLLIVLLLLQPSR